MKEKISGVGSSIGLDRLIAGLEQLGVISKKGSFVDLEIFCVDASLSVEYQGLAQKFREKGISCEVFPDAKKIGQQYNVTDKKGIKWGILMNAENAKSGTFTLKNLATREQFENCTVEQASKIICC
jgi:histidyl-tRNA synthetase